jgi:hypothetical protein
VRHALIAVHLVQEARAAADAEADERQARQAPATPQAHPEPRPRSRRLATMARRARAMVARPA